MADLGSKFTAVSASVGGKETVKVVANGAASATSSALFGPVLLGGFAVISAISNQIEYNGERAEIANFYREELAAKNNKQQKQVSTGDLEKAEKDNAAIDGAVSKARNFRNVGIAASFIASVAVYGLIAAVTASMPAIPVLSLAFGAKMLLGGLGYLAVKEPLTKLGVAVMGLDKTTTHDLIVDIAKDRENGKAITREQVVEVFVSGNPQLASYVERSFGREYRDLALADKVRVASELANILPIDKIAHNINLGTTNASELAYTVQGDVSGVLPKQPEEKSEPNAWQKFAHKCKTLAHSVTGMFRPEKAHLIPEIRRNEVEQTERDQKAIEEGTSPVVEFNHVERLGRDKHQHKGHLEAETERRANNVALAGTPTIQ